MSKIKLIYKKSFTKLHDYDEEETAEEATPVKPVKRLIPCLLLFLIATNALAAPAGAAPELELTARSAVLIETETGKILYAQNAEEPLPPASLTKIMTLLVAMEELKLGRVQWDTVITTSQRAWATGGSQMFLNINQQVTFEELIKGIAVISANDATVVVAEYLFGSVEAFVQRMNQRAA